MDNDSQFKIRSFQTYLSDDEYHAFTIKVKKNGFNYKHMIRKLILDYINDDGKFTIHFNK